MWCWNQVPVEDLAAGPGESPQLRMGGHLQSFTQVASSSTLILSQSAGKGTSFLKETKCTTTLQNSTALRGCSCQTSLISFPLSPPGMVQLQPSWETMAAAFNAITAVFSHSPHLFPMFTASVSVPRLPAQPTAVVSNGVQRGTGLTHGQFISSST